MSEKITNRVSALLTKANDPACTEEEALAYMAKVEELMARYEISLDDLEKKGKVEREEIGSSYFKFPEAKCFWRSLGVLGAFRVSEALGLCGFAHSSRGQYIFLYGTPENRENTQAVLETVFRRARAALKTYRATDADLAFLKAVFGPDSTEYWNAQYSYLAGFCEGYADRIRHSRRKVVREVTGADLVLVSRKAEIDRFMEDDGVGKSRSSRIANGSAFREGKRDGYSADQGNVVTR